MGTNIILFLIFVSVFASVMTQGFWSNTINLINVITAGLIATNYFEPVADYLDKQFPAWTYIWDFTALWLLFAFSMVFLRAATDAISKVQVRFFLPVEKVGGYLMAVWVSWLVMSFATMTLHTAPLARNFLWDSFQQDPDHRMFFGLQPDRVWLGWVHKQSQGALSRFSNVAPFDANGAFIAKYSNRRGEFENQLSLTKSGGSGGAAPTTPAQ